MKHPLTKKIALAKINALKRDTDAKLRSCASEWARNIVYIDAMDEFLELARTIAHQLPKEL